MNEQIKKFESGKSYEMHFIGDSKLRPAFVCIGRPEKTATFQRGSETIKRKLKISDGCEFVLQGSYSMSPSINAKNEVK